jgi:bifunctional non-homologous end joining protein LigD
MCSRSYSFDFSVNCASAIYHIRAIDELLPRGEEISRSLPQDFFEDLKIESFIKTSGKTGLHIFVPIANLYTYEQTRAFAEAVGRILLKRHPEKITMEWETRKRKGRVLFDHNQNARGKTIASVFSARPTESATVSVPVKWKDLSSILPTDYTILNLPDILDRILGTISNQFG